MTEPKSVETLLQEMLAHTQLLEQCILNPESDPEEWLKMLDEREKMINELSDLTSKGTHMTEQIREIYDSIHEINKRLVPLMMSRQQEVSGKIAKLKQSQIANKQYKGYGAPAAYGAFFDKKK
jgi:flagellar protein FliT